MMKYDQYAQIDIKPDSTDFMCQNTLLKDNDLEVLKSKLRDEVCNEIRAELTQQVTYEITQKLEHEKQAFHKHQELEKQKFESEKSEQMR